jgi:hypothetical protein
LNVARSSLSHSNASFRRNGTSFVDAGVLARTRQAKEETSMGTILLIILILLIVGALPTWPYSSGWGYYPSGGLGLILVIIIVLLLAGRI